MLSQRWSFMKEVKSLIGLHFLHFLHWDENTQRSKHAKLHWSRQLDGSMTLYFFEDCLHDLQITMKGGVLGCRFTGDCRSFTYETKSWENVANEFKDTNQRRLHRGDNNSRCWICKQQENYHQNTTDTHFKITRERRHISHFTNWCTSPPEIQQQLQGQWRRKVPRHLMERPILSCNRARKTHSDWTLKSLTATAVL